MSVSRKDGAQSQDMFITGLRLGSEAKVLAATYILPVNSMPVQLLDANGAGRIVKLPLAAPEGRVWILVNTAAGAFALTITDDVDAAIAGGTLLQNQQGMYMKRGAIYVKIFEGVFA
jgi:hypothetical protein